MFPGCETIKCWHLRRKKQSRNNRRENSLAAHTASGVGWSQAQELLAQTHTPTLMLAFTSCAIELRAQSMCAHTCARTPSQGCVIPGIQLRAACLGGLRVSRHSFAPTTVPLASSCTGLCARWTPCTGASDGAQGKPSDPCP